MKYDMVKDSGKRLQYAGGAVRDTAKGKGRYDLLPAYAMYRLAAHYENGAQKYTDRNWEKGIPTSRFMDSALRHLFQYLGGDRSEDHIAAAAWNALGLIETEHRIAEGRLPQELDTLPQPVPVPQTALTGASIEQELLTDRLNQLSETALDFLECVGIQLEDGGILCSSAECSYGCAQFMALCEELCK
jgi:hypothetical protein